MLRYLVGALVVLLLLPAASAHAGRTQESIFQDDRLLLFYGGQARERALNEMDALGADTIHALMVWSKVAPRSGSTRRPAGFDGSDPAAYDASAWDPWDSLVRSADARGLDVLLTPTGFIPIWASRCRGSAELKRTCRPSPNEFRRFVMAAGKRYSGQYRDENQGGGVLPRVNRWSIWNEPNQGGWLTPQYTRRRGRTVPEAPHVYRDLARYAISGLRKTGHARDSIYIGETAPLGRETGSLTTRPISGVDFYRELFCMDSRGRRLRGSDARRRRGCTRYREMRGVDGVAHHPYTRGAGGSPRSRTKSDWITISTMGRLERELNRGARLGRIRRGAPVYITEFGFQTDPPDPNGVSLSRQAAYINESNYMAFRRGRIRAFAQYELEDEPHVGTFNTGLRLSSGRAKPALEAYRTPIWVERRRGRIYVFGQVRPADSGQAVEIQFRERGERYRTLAEDRVNRAGYVHRRFRLRSGYWRIAWKDGNGRTVYSRTAKAARR